MSKTFTWWIWPPHILPLRLNHHVPMVLLWQKNIISFQSRRLSFNPWSTPLQVCLLLLLNQIMQVILVLRIIIYLSNVWYKLYHTLPRSPKVFCVSWKIIYLTYFTCSSNINVRFLRGEAFLNMIGLFMILIKFYHCYLRDQILT